MPVDTKLHRVFDAGLPTFDYDVTATPADVQALIRDAQLQAPIAIGPLGPEILSCELARDVLRDSRFSIPQGITLAAQAITSSPLFEKAMASLRCLDGDAHQRLRRLVAKAFTAAFDVESTLTAHA